MKKNHKKLRQQVGITLLELMISMTIGLILLMSLASLMVTATRTANQRSISELSDEAARQIFTRLESAILMANYVDPFERADAVNTRVNSLVSGADSPLIDKYAKKIGKEKKDYGAISEITNGFVWGIEGCPVSLNDEGNCDSPNATPEKFQGIKIAYEGNRYGSDNTNNYASLTTLDQEKTLETGSLYACSGAGIPSTSEHSLTQSNFRVKLDNNPEFGTQKNNFYCQAKRYKPNQKAANAGELDPVSYKEAGKDETQWQPLVDGLEEMRFRYLVTEANTTTEELKLDDNGVLTIQGRNVQAYMQPNNVPNHALGWNAVVGVEVCIILAVDANDLSQNAQNKVLQPEVPTCARADVQSESPWAPFANDVPRDPNDKRVYRRYTRIFQVPNNINLPLVSEK